MALVAYSDSEGSDNEASIVTSKSKSSAPKPSLFKKLESRKIQVELPTTRPESGGAVADDAADQPPAKRAKTAGAFGGFNSLLPAPKRVAAQSSGLKKGVSLRTSSEAAFSRAAPLAVAEAYNEELGSGEYDEYGDRAQVVPTEKVGGDTLGLMSTEVKITGRSTRFRPLSVANGRKKKVVKKPVVAGDRLTASRAVVSEAEAVETAESTAPIVKVKKSLFSVQEDGVPVDTPAEDEMEDIATDASMPNHDELNESATFSAPAPNSLEAVAADLNLTSAQRRQLFGRQGKNGTTNIAHFNMDAEYANNEQIRQSGESVAHKAVKAVAPGKHSLQQLVNNARSNQDSIEDKWAEGRRNRSEGGSKYGWSNG
ncbi:hypothetical protein LTR62_007811 [Meristemomyces frigidus]|uniref:Uncharacterized protein n=1 Tax=Meristemomyces frigidus TaxID=1508187 RepID=A0AAN7TBG3_9PEZI|nr:hypothetical protein LTR62_007811 [Meristemomyces frigidus]